MAGSRKRRGLAGGGVGGSFENPDEWEMHRGAPAGEADMKHLEKGSSTGSRTNWEDP